MDILLISVLFVVVFAVGYVSGLCEGRSEIPPKAGSDPAAPGNYAGDLFVIRAMQELLKMLPVLEDMKNEIAATRSVMASALVLINGMAEKLKAAVDADDMAAVGAMVADLRAGSAELAAAVTANTVAAAEPAPVDVPVDAPVVPPVE